LARITLIADQAVVLTLTSAYETTTWAAAEPTMTLQTYAGGTRALAQRYKGKQVSIYNIDRGMNRPRFHRVERLRDHRK
jgi:hypothetical protein